MPNPFRIVWLKAAIAALIPALTTLVGAFGLYQLTGLPTHWKIFLAVTFASASISGLSALGSFLSTTYSEHKAKQESGIDDTAPAPITAAQVAASPESVIVPSPTPKAAQPPTKG